MLYKYAESYEDNMNCFLALPNLTCHCICFRDFKKKENIVGWKWRSDVILHFVPFFFPEVTALWNLVQNLLQGMFLYYFYKQISILMHDFACFSKLHVMVSIYIYMCVCVTQICFSTQLCFWDLFNWQLHSVPQCEQTTINVFIWC